MIFQAKLSNLKIVLRKNCNHYLEKIEPGETVPVFPKSMKLKELNKEMIGYTYDYYNTLKDNKLIGIKATVESFIHDLNVFDYLINMSVNENKTPFGKLKKYSDSMKIN